MKEKIYTIPINEAYETDCECPLCKLEAQLESDGIDYALGAAMMEPDYRVESNSVGYCNKHFGMMFAKPNKLSLALVLDTHLAEIREKLGKMEKKAEGMSKGKSSIFKRSANGETISEISGQLKQIQDGCMVCNKINHTMERYADVLLYMWANDAQFKAKFDKSKGVCLKHMQLLLETSKKSLNDKQAGMFAAELLKKQIGELERIQEDIHKFTLKFDYRYTNMEWGTAQDAPVRTIEKISGRIRTAEDEENENA